MLKKLVTVCLALSILFGITVPCLAADDGPPVKISIALWEIDPNALADDPVYKMISEKFNIEIDPIPLTWDDYGEKVTTWVNTISAPDVFNIDLLPYNYPKYLQWVKEEMLQPIPADLSKYPNLEKIFDLPGLQATAIDGVFYCVPRLQGTSEFSWWFARSLFYRKDWAQQLGLEAPTNINELADFVRAMLDGDPTGTGVKDIVGITGWDRGFLLDTLWPSIEPRGFASWQVEPDGTVMKAFNAPKSYEAALKIREMYNEGLIDPDILIQDSNAGGDKFATGKAAVYAFQMIDNNFFFDQFAASNPDKDISDCVGAIYPLRNVYDNNAYVFNTTCYWSETYISADVDDVKLDRILQLLDYCAGDEFMDIIKYGIEGEDYVREGEVIVYLTPDGERPDVFAKYRFLEGFQFLTLWPSTAIYEVNAFNAYTGALARDYCDWITDNGTLRPATLAFDSVLTPLAEDFGAVEDDAGTAFFNFMFGRSGGDPEAEWAAMMDALKANGLDAMVEEMANAAREAGTLK